LTLLMAGGRGERLYPLTRSRAKPAVSFGGAYRVIDFTLSNCLNSGIKNIYLLTQYSSMTLDRHVHLAWSFFNRELGEFLDSVPPQHLIANKWYEGTADSVYQNIRLLEEHRPELVLILSGDHVYKMDYGPMVAFHLQNKAHLTVGTVDMPIEQSDRFGVLQMDAQNRLVGFEEKPERGAPHPADPSRILINMGVYVFDTFTLVKELIEDYKQDSSHDFGKDIIPRMIQKGMKVYAYEFVDENRQESKYWRDIGDLDSFFEANMDLVQVSPIFNLYDQEWPIHTYRQPGPPAKTVFDGPGRRGRALNSLLSSGVIVSGSLVERTILSSHVYVHNDCHVADSILMPYADVGEGCKIYKAIVDEAVSIPAGTEIGLNAEEDAKRFTISKEGIVVVPSGFAF
jgi:glucose-1-phosphate adenylyltransferase